MKSENSTLTIFTDGGARGNPGEAAYGFVVYDENKNIVYKEGKRIGVTTNNVAEYMGVVSALKWVVNTFQNTDLKIKFFLDSQLVASQLAGIYKIKNEGLKNYYFTAKDLEEKLNGEVIYQNIARENNKEADKLVNLALDNQI